MDRRTFIKKTSAAIPALSFMNIFSSCKRTNDQKPNIIFILADDLGYGDLSCYGQKLFYTPNIDKLAQEGMKFTQHYAGSPVCAPSRCVLFSGKHTGHACVRGNMQAEPSGQLPIPEDELTFSKLLQENGYKTGCFGKWGLGIAGSTGDPQKHGFDEFFGYYDQVLAHNSFPEFLYKNGEKVFLDNKVQYVSEDHWSKGLGSISTGKNEYSNDIIFDEALKFIENNRQHPFFLYFTTTIPHDNGEAPKGDRYEIPDIGRFEDKDWSDEEKVYAALVEKLDSYAGLIEKKLKELNIDQNTNIIFTSDNGAVNDPDLLNRFQNNGIFRGAKRDVYEGGIRVPLIVKWPARVKQGSISHHISGFQDFFPTICEITGIDCENNRDGISFLPTLLNKKQKEHPYLYWEFYWWNPTRRALRMRTWKVVQNAPDAAIELYNLKNDPGEQVNLADKYPEKIQAVKELFKQAHQPSELWEIKN
jgi:arylsulfatase A